MTQRDDLEQLRAWAHGNYGLEAAVELLARVQRGRFLTSGWPWLHVEDDGRPWVDFAAMARPDAPLSGGEVRVLRLASSLAGEAEVNLGETLEGMDRKVVSLVLAAVAHTAGSHEHVEYVPTRDPDDVEVISPLSPRIDPGPLYSWPDDGMSGDLLGR